MTFTYKNLNTQDEVRNHIRDCEGRHSQQVAYSTFHDSLTQVCFGCRAVRTNIKICDAKELISSDKPL